MKTKIHYYVLLAFVLAFLTPKANAQTLVQFWDFNNTLPSGGGGGDSLGNVTNPLKASAVAAGLDTGHIIYSRPSKVIVGAPHADSILDNGNPGAFIYDFSTTNDSSGGNNFVRARNPCDSSVIDVYIPTTGYKNIKMEYAISASSTKGANYNLLSYSTNGGTTWNHLTRAMDTFNVSGVYMPDTLQMINPTTSGSNWYPVQIDFSSDANVNNNANFVVRMMPIGPNSIGTSGNDRYDNFAVWGTVVTGISELPATGGYNVYPNPATNMVTINSASYKGDKIITMYNVVGQTVSVTETHSMETNVNTSALNAGVYFIEIKEVATGNKYTTKIIKE